MSQSYRFPSDTNEQLAEQVLEQAGCRTSRDLHNRALIVEGDVTARLADAIRDLGGLPG